MIIAKSIGLIILKHIADADKQQPTSNSTALGFEMLFYTE
jgi:hypothetical protein